MTTFSLTYFFLITLAVVNCNLLETFNTHIGEDYTDFPKDQETSFRAYAHRDNVVEDIMWRYYNGKTLEDYVEIKLRNSNELMSQENFNNDKVTVFYIHGYKETAEQESVHTVVKAYLDSRPDDNIVLIDWSNMAMGNYFINAAPNTRKVAHAIAEEMKKLIDSGLTLDLIHIVGHSLGGQTAGFIGKEMQKLGHKLRRISALDPAFPMFYPGLTLGHIEGEDADFVDIIHTDAGFYGAPVKTGTVDFWPNDGKRTQPGCKFGVHLPMSDDDLCDHWRSWHFWAESVASPNNFPATQKGKTGVVYMGYAADKKSRGNYYLKTNADSPFGMGMGGIVKN